MIEFHLLKLYMAPYLLGLILGLIYMFLFVDLNRIRTGISKRASFLLLCLIGVIYIISYSIFLLDIHGLSVFSSLSTNSAYAILMSAVCFLSALYFFGFINIPIAKLSKTSNSFTQSLRLIFNFHFLWILFNGILLSQSIFNSPVSSLMCLLGISSGIIFLLLKIQFSKTVIS